MFGEGIAKVGELIDLGVQLGLVQKSGSWFSKGEIRLGQGKDSVKQYLYDNPEEMVQLEADIRANAYKLLPVSTRPQPNAATAAGSNAAPAVSGKAAAAGRGVDISAEDFEDEDM